MADIYLGPVWMECYDSDDKRYYAPGIIEFDGYMNGLPHVVQRHMTPEEIEEYDMTTPPQPGKALP